jgi:hypothetical protein
MSGTESKNMTLRSLNDPARTGIERHSLNSNAIFGSLFTGQRPTASVA